MGSVVRVGQLSDTHFLEEGNSPEGGHGYDTGEAFEAVLEHLGDHSYLDLMVVTGDVADHGLPAQYEVAAEAFSRLTPPVNLCPGNHDFDLAFQAGFGTDALKTERVINIGNWAFVFVDSNAGQMVTDHSGNLVDPPGEERLHANGALGKSEAAWFRDTCASVEAEHVFVWVHHPPGVDIALSADEAYTAEWADLLGDIGSIRGIGGGHTHVPTDYTFVERPVFVAPSFKNNFDLEAQTWLPPGYRTYDFHEDGLISSEVHLVDDDRWPRRPLGRALMSLFRGELTYAELAVIAERRAKAN